MGERPSQSFAEAAQRGQGGPGLPFVLADGDGTDDLFRRFPLTRYAEISLSLARGDHRATIFARNELSDAAWLAIATASSQGLQQDPQFHNQFHEHLKELRSRK